MDDLLTRARIDLAAALRLAARFDLNEGICNHFSFAPPERPDAFLVNPFGKHWSQLSASDLLLVDFDGRVLEGDGRSEEHTSELQSLMRISYAVFCLKKNKQHN